MNRIVREHYPAARLPEELRAGLDLDAHVTVSVVVEHETRHQRVDLDAIFARAGKSLSRTADEIDAELHALRGRVATP